MTGCVNKHITENPSERLTEHMTEDPNERLTEHMTERMTERAQHTEQETEYMAERAQHTEQVSITGLAYGPNAVGRLTSGKVVFVPQACPGDVVRVKITKETASYCEGRIVELIEPGSARVAPTCAYAGVCGGCPWMHIAYEAQLQAKRSQVVNQLIRVGQIEATRAEELVAPCCPSKRVLGYRNKIELGAEWNDGVFNLGFHGNQYGCASLVSAADECLLAPKAISKAPRALRGALRYLQGSTGSVRSTRSGGSAGLAGSVRPVDSVRPDESIGATGSATRDLGIFRVGVRHSVRTKSTEIALWTTPGPFPRKMVAETLASALPCTSIVRVMADKGKARKIKGVEALYGKGYWEEDLAGSRFTVSAPSFFQVNTPQAESMIAEVLEGLSLDARSRVADLYCGVGSFTIPLAKRCGEVFGVEAAGSSVRDLRRNAQASGANVEVIGGDSAREITKLGQLDALVVDPPRAGLSEKALGGVVATAPKQIAYVSCNPATLARDVARFAQAGYQPWRVVPFDLFPQTYHVETVTLLSKGKTEMCRKV